MIFVNNAIYSMTGGQFAPTTLLGQKSTTCPEGRNRCNEGYPLHMELLATLEAPVYIERVGLGDNKQIAGAARAIKRAVENQVRGLGFSLIEVLTPCPTIWKMTPVEAQRWVKETMEKTFPLGVFRDHTREAQPRPAAKAAPALEELPRILEIDNEDGRAGETVVVPNAKNVDLRVRVAGFGGQGVLLLGEMLAEAGLEAGLEVSWLPSYGPEMRSGTSNCQVRIASEEIDSPLVPVPNVLIAMNEPSLRKFDGSVRPGGWVIYNGDTFPEDCKRADVQVLALPFSQLANELGDPRMANMIMLGVLLEITQNLPQASIDTALRRLVKKPKLVELGQQALERGHALFRASL